MGRDTYANFILVTGFIVLVSMFSTHNADAEKKQENDLKMEQKVVSIEENIDSSIR